jgi:hypothetical protein
MVGRDRRGYIARLRFELSQLKIHRVPQRTLHQLVVLVCSVALLPGDVPAWGSQTAPAAPTPPAQTQSQPQAKAVPSTNLPPDQLDSLVAPIALYPDPLLAQTLAASTYPLEIIQLQQWLQDNKTLKDQALADAVAKQSWDPSVQSMAGMPDLVDRLANDIQWTTDLGNAFLAQESDVMDSVQRMRKKAQDKGTLKSTEQQKVDTQVIESKSVIVIEQSNPQTIYVPAYDPVVVYGPPIYPYPPIYYPPYYPGALAISFGVGMFMGAMWGGGWCCGCGWGGNDITINRNNNFNRNSNIGGGNRPSQLPSGGRGNLGGGNRPSQLPSDGRGDLGGNRGDRGNRPSQLPAGGGGDRWQHNPSHRGGTPYRDRATADRFGGVTRGDSLSRRQASARQQLGRGGGVATPRATSFERGGGAGGLGAGGNRSLGGGADRIGSRDLSRPGGGNGSAFGGGGRGFDGSSARQSGSRGSSSMGSRGGGGFSRGGGGGSRGGGGRRR